MFMFVSVNGQGYSEHRPLANAGPILSIDQKWGATASYEIAKPTESD